MTRYRTYHKSSHVRAFDDAHHHDEFLAAHHMKVWTPLAPYVDAAKVRARREHDNDA